MLLMYSTASAYFDILMNGKGTILKKTNIFIFLFLFYFFFLREYNLSLDTFWTKLVHTL